MNIKNAITNYLPTPIKRIQKKIEYKKKYPNTIISPETIIAGHTTNNLKIGKNTIIHQGVYLEVFGKIEIGKNTIISTGTKILSSTHDYTTKPITKGKVTSTKTIIGNDVWLGANVIILAGKKIANGSIIGAGAIVTKNTKPYNIYAGVPAKKIKKRKISEKKWQ